MVGLPGSPASLLPPAPDDLVRRMRDLERRMDEALPSVARSFAPVIADLAAKQAALDAANVTLTAQQADLAAQLVSINALIGAQVQHGSSGTSETAFSVNTTHTLRATGSITVPAGFTRVTVLCTVDATAINGVTTAGAYLQVQASIAGTPGGTATGYAGYGYQTGASASAIRTITGLSGGTIALGAVVFATADFGTSALNLADVNAIAIFTR